MPELSWEAVLNEDIAIASSTIPLAQGEDVTKNPGRAVQGCAEDTRIGNDSVSRREAASSQRASDAHAGIAGRYYLHFVPQRLK